MTEQVKFDAVEMLRDACQRHSMDLAVLVADTAIWANPEVHRRLLAENGTGAYFPGFRRAKVGAGEIRGTIIDGDALDDNGRANQAIKRSVGVKLDKIKGFEACHLWPGTAYDARYHTVVANLVLLPRALAGLSDHDADILAKLQFRAFELYGWHPEEAMPPVKPQNYPTCWREPEPFTPEVEMALMRRLKNASRAFDDELTPSPPAPDQEETTVMAPTITTTSLMSPDELASVVEKIRRWAMKPDTIAHQTIGLVLRAQFPQTRQNLARAVEEGTGSSNGLGVVASLLTSTGNAYGRVLIDREGIISLHPDILEEVHRHGWS